MMSLLLVASAWEAFRPATCMPDDCFCEAIQSGFVRQPANTWSSLAFVATALWVWRRSIRNRAARKAALGGSETLLFVAVLILTGLGSAFYHASLTFIGQVLDVSGMYFLATFMLLHRVGPRFGLTPARRAALFVIANAALMIAQVTAPSARRVVFAILLMGALAVEWNAGALGRRFLARGALLMVIAGLVWFLDRRRLMCDPDAAIQGHAIWHVLGAIAASYLYRCYEAEADTPGEAERESAAAVS